MTEEISRKLSDDKVYRADTSLAKASQIAQILALILAAFSLPSYLLTTGLDASLAVIIILVISIGAFGVIGMYLSRAVGSNEPSPNDIEWTVLIDRIAVRKQFMIALGKEHRYGVIVEGLLWEIHRAYLVAEAYNHPTLAKAFLDDYNAVLEERKLNSDWEPDLDFEKTMRKAAMEGAGKMIKQLGLEST